MEETIILEGIDEIGQLFLNRVVNNINLKFIIAKDYGVEYGPLKIFKVNVNTKRFILEPIDQLKNNPSKSESEKKWMTNIYQGTTKALYRANLECFNQDPWSKEVPDESDIIFDSYLADEIAIIPDTSSLMDGLITRLIGNLTYDADLNIYLPPTVIKELQQHAMGRQKQFKFSGNDKKKEDLFINFAEEKRKSRIALRTLAELVECRTSKVLRVKLIENVIQDGNVPDWNILLEAKSLHLDMPKYFVTNDLIQSALADLIGLKTKYMYPIHLLNKDVIELEGVHEVGKALYDLAIQYGEIIIESEDCSTRFILQSDWKNKMSPSWVNKILYTRIEYNDEKMKEKIIKVINKKRPSDKRIDDYDPRLDTLL